MVPADLRPALLPEVAVASRTRRHRGIPDQVRVGHRVAPRAGPHHQGQAFGRFRRRLRPEERGPAAGPARRRRASDRIPHPLAVQCPAVRLPLPPEQYPKGKPGPKPQVGSRLEPPRRGGMWKAKWQVGTAFVYGRQREIRWKEIICLWRVLGWEVPVKAIVASVEGYKERFTLVTSAVELTGLQMVELFTAVPAGGRVPRPEAAAGLGGVPGVDGQPDPADQPGAVGDDEPAAVVAVSAGGVWKGGLVVPAAVEQEEGSSQRTGRAAADAAASGANSAISLEAGGNERITEGDAA